MIKSTRDKVAEIFLEDAYYETKVAYLSRGKEVKIIVESLGRDNNEALVETFKVIATALNRQLTIDPELKVLVEQITNLGITKSNRSENQLIH